MIWDLDASVKTLVNSEGIENFQSADCCYILSWIKRLIELPIQGGSLSSHVIILCGIQLRNSSVKHMNHVIDVYILK